MSRKIRVLQIVNSLAIGKQAGGADTHAINIALRLDKQQYETAVFRMYQYQEEIENVWETKLRHQHTDLFGSSKPSARFAPDAIYILKDLWQCVNKFKPDIINSHSERGDWLNLLIRMLHPSHPEVVRTIHVDKRWITSPFLGRYLLDRKICPAFFSQEIAVSISILEQLHSRNKKQLCYNSIDRSFFEKEENAISKESILPKSISPESYKIGIVSRLTEQKGHESLIHVFSALIREGRNVSLIIVGDGPLLNELAALVDKLQVSDSVHFLGIRNDVKQILQKLDLFVLPSFWEGFPTVLLEAMSQNVPVVASDVSGSRELVQSGKTGWLVTPGDEGQLLRAIRGAMVDSPEAEKLAEAGREFASQFTLSNMIACYSQIYTRILTKKWTRI